MVVPSRANVNTKCRALAFLGLAGLLQDPAAHLQFGVLGFRTGRTETEACWGLGGLMP